MLSDLHASSRPTSCADYLSLGTGSCGDLRDRVEPLQTQVQFRRIGAEPEFAAQARAGGELAQIEAGVLTPKLGLGAQLQAALPVAAQGANLLPGGRDAVGLLLSDRRGDITVVQPAHRDLR